MATSLLVLSLLIKIALSGNHIMDNVHLRVSAINELHALAIIRNPRNSSDIRYTGFTKNIFDWLSTSLNFSYSFVPIPEKVVKERGIPGAALNYLIRKEVDTISSYLIMTPERYALADCTYPLMFTGYALGQPMPKFQTRWFASLKPFKPAVWFLVAIFMVAIATIFSFHTLYMDKKKKEPKVQVVGRNLIYAFTILTGQGENFTSAKHSLRVVAAGWGLAAVVLVNVYNGTLVSFLSVPKYEPIVNSLEQLAHSKTLQLVPFKGTVVTNIILNATSGFLKTLGDSLRKNHKSLVSSDSEALQLLSSGRYTFVAPDTTVLIYISKTITGADQCQLTSSKSVGFVQAFTYLMAKNYKYKDAINEKLMTLFQTGLVKHWSQVGHAKKASRCLNFHIDRPNKMPISLISLSGAFLILGIGAVVSIFVFILELHLEYYSILSR